MGDEPTALPVSPPIFVPAAVTSAPAERAPWVVAAAGLSVIGLPITLALAFGTRDGDFQRWSWQPFLPGAGWGVLVMRRLPAAEAPAHRRERRRVSPTALAAG